jgi:hypothetical protein
MKHNKLLIALIGAIATIGAASISLVPQFKKNKGPKGTSYLPKLIDNF